MELRKWLDEIGVVTGVAINDKAAIALKTYVDHTILDRWMN